MIRGAWSHVTLGWIVAASLIPVAATLVLERGAAVLAPLLLSGLVILVWQVVFRFGGGVPLAPAGAVTAVAVALMAPPELPLWQIAVGVSFGTVIGELVFGGWGRNVLSGAVVALAFLSLSNPNAELVAAGNLVAVGVLPAAVVLLATGVLPFAVIAAGAAGFALAAGALGVEAPAVAALGTLAFALVFLLGDPVASAATVAGRWITGAAAGALAALLLAGPAGAAQAAVFATLLGSIFAPLIDQGAIAAGQSLRRRRHG